MRKVRPLPSEISSDTTKMSGFCVDVVELELLPLNDGILEVGMTSGDSPDSLTTSELVSCDSRLIIA